MYRVIIYTAGIHNNVTTGIRYCLGKRKMRKFINSLLEVDCEIRVEKFIRCGGFFCWGDDHDLYSGYWYEGDD